MGKNKFHILMILFSSFCLCAIGNNDIPIEYNNRTLDFFVEDVLLECRDINDVYNIFDSKKFMKLVSYLKENRESMIPYIESVSKEKCSNKKISVCVKAYKVALGKHEFSDSVTAVLDDEFDYFIKKIFIEENINYLIFNYATDLSQKQLLKILDICPENERLLYLSILSGERLMDYIGLYSTGELKYLIGLDANKHFKDNFSEEMNFLRDDKNLSLVYFATALPRLEAFVAINKKYTIDINELSFEAISIEDLKIFLANNIGVTPQDDMKKLSQLKEFFKLSLFSIAEVENKICSFSDNNPEKRFWIDCLSKSKKK